MAERVSWVLRIASDPVCYLWTGFARLQTPPDAVDPSGAVWSGAGEIVTIPSLQVLINGRAERIELVLSGVAASTLRLGRADVASIRMAECRIGRVQFDRDWQIVGPVAYEWFGIADAVRVKSIEGGEARSRSITIMVGSSDTFRANPLYAHWTDAAQRALSPDDAFCDQVASIGNSITRRFGPR